jgi:hypothetical protein
MRHYFLMPLLLNSNGGNMKKLLKLSLLTIALTTASLGAFATQRECVNTNYSATSFALNVSNAYTGKTKSGLKVEIFKYSIYPSGSKMLSQGILTVPTHGTYNKLQASQFLANIFAKIGEENKGVHYDGTYCEYVSPINGAVFANSGSPEPGSILATKKTYIYAEAVPNAT